MSPAPGAPTWVLLEGESDVAALRALRAAHGVAAEVEPCRLVPMGGATNIRHHLGLAVAQPNPPRVVGLCDEREAPFFVRALQLHRHALGIEGHVTLGRLPELGFHVCRRDLEDELLRALDVAGTLAVFDELGLLESFRAFTRQPAWQGRPMWDQLRRFGTTTSGRKELLAAAFAAAVPVEATPAPLAALIASMPSALDASPG
jgi:hypothetical protein